MKNNSAALSMWLLEHSRYSSRPFSLQDSEIRAQMYLQRCSNKSLLIESAPLE